MSVSNVYLGFNLTKSLPEKVEQKWTFHWPCNVRIPSRKKPK